MALERVPADIRKDGGVARMSDPQMIKEIMDTVTIPVMAKARIGHFVECQVRPPKFKRSVFLRPGRSYHQSSTLDCTSDYDMQHLLIYA
jgi:hypothetical protein